MDVGDGTPGSEAQDSPDRRMPAVERESGGLALELAPHLASIGRGRRWVATEAVRQGVTDTRVRIIQLLSSELIANAILHGPPGGRVCVRVARSDDTFRVEVDDASASSPRLIPITRDGGGGRGLALVERLADQWGYERRDTLGNTVWFEVRVTRQVPGTTSGATTPPAPRRP
jgi:serine/threonine-protein kinase RsbW